MSIRNRAVLLTVLSVLSLAGGAALAAAQRDDGPAPGAGTAAAAAVTAEPSAPVPGTASGSGGASATASRPGSASASASASATGSASARARTRASGTATAATDVPTVSTSGLAAPHVFTGKAFDACTAPSLATMTAWRSASPYGAAAVYIGGPTRACGQANLTSSWVSSVHAAGWELIPLYAGSQADCGGTMGSGSADGAQAVADAAALGMRAGSAVYLDMEAYDTSDAACVQAVTSYVRAWVAAVHARGYWAGYYSYSHSGTNAIIAAKNAGTPGLPDALWYADYDGAADTVSGWPGSGGQWTGHRRGHQYTVNSKETYGGRTVTVDRDAWDAPVAVVR
ncbi:glycoside hydrolase domain-containing protein [Streptacidiphilus monticola]|uniref:Glycoside hydrolase domain-containing protein n=1 Tax=Streptacidiphilus monticola TaxID=2161674 RepID=A0ABW1G5Y9_9ACTN